MTPKPFHEKKLLHESSAPTYDLIVAKLLRAIAGAPQEVYSPSDDSFLMLDVLSKLSVEGKAVLDVGTGSGILALFCALRGARVTASDIDEKALRHTSQAAEKLGVTLQLISSNLFSSIPGRFDLILFNPPYLPSTTTRDQTVDGGVEGKVKAEKFLETLAGHMKKDGSALLLLSSATDLGSLLKAHSEFEFSTVASRSLFFEELRVLELRFRGASR